MEETVRLWATAENMKDGVLYPRKRRSFDEDIAHHPNHELTSKDEIEMTVLQDQKDAEKNLPLS